MKDVYNNQEKYIGKILVSIKKLQQFLKLEAAGGIILFFTALLAIVIDNSPLSGLYNSLLALPFSLHLGVLLLKKPLVQWVNDGLMVLFFLTVGLELKREMYSGYLSKFSDVVLPMIAALGGMVLPALIYCSLNYHDPIAIKGWAIPVATDIAFALAVISLLGKRIPVPLKLFLLAVTIFDDIGAIVIIALFHTHTLSYTSLYSALVVIFLLIALNMLGVKKITPYVLLGFVLWVCVLKSGVHATLAGIILALTIPADSPSKNIPSPLIRMEAGLVPWVSFLIVPLFGFTNAGISFTGAMPGTFSNTIVWGIILGLFFGKQLGVFLFSWVCIVLRLCKLPQGTSWFQLYGIGLLCGIGFTMSLFIGTLTFHGETVAQLVSVRFAVLVASIIAGLVGYLLLRSPINESP